MTIVTVEEVRTLKNRLREINAIPFTEIEWRENGAPIAVLPGVADEFRFTGLSNTDFIDLGIYKEQKFFAAPAEERTAT